ELVAQHGCHLVITDLEMPRMTGYELMAQVRQSPTTRRIPVMIVTSRAGAKHRDRALKEGASAFLTKPVQEDQLLAAVEQLMGKEAERHLVPVRYKTMVANTLKKIRVLIVDDSAFMRKVLETILITDENVQVVGHAKDGREAVRLSESLKPDVITMDINMPVMDGLQATAEIMTTNPRPIVVVSSESRQGAASTLRALELGAIEFVAKPS